MLSPLSEVPQLWVKTIHVYIRAMEKYYNIYKVQSYQAIYNLTFQLI